MIRRDIACRHRIHRGGGQKQKGSNRWSLGGDAIRAVVSTQILSAPRLATGSEVEEVSLNCERRVSTAGNSRPLPYCSPTWAQPQRTISMTTMNGNVALSGVTDKEMELIWAFKAKHGTKLQFNPQQIQVNNRPEGSTYNNVMFTYSDLHSFNVVAEIVNELHKQESKAA